MRRVLILGGGGREHALAWACRRDQGDVEIICAPGNAGTAEIAENVPIDVEDAPAVAALAADRAAGLVVIGPDAAAAAGVADACQAAGIAVFGPSAAAAQIEASKAFAKQLMGEAGIPTARWVSGGQADRTRLGAFIRELGGACVVKADGLALGKGVVVCGSLDEAELALAECLDRARFGAAGSHVVIEERLHGPEVSVLGLSDGEHVRLLPTARDHKRACDGDTGPNTGGMGAIAPSPGIDNQAMVSAALDRVLQPCVDALRARGTPFVGCLYAGLMLTSDGLRTLEFNARFGDPEAQVLLPLVDEPVLDLFAACARGELQPGFVRAARVSAVGVVAASAGYPGAVRTGDRIDGLDALDDRVLCFHAGTRRDDDGTLRTAGGRVLAVIARADTPDEARHEAYANLARVHFEGMHFRRDIGAGVMA